MKTFTNSQCEKVVDIEPLYCPSSMLEISLALQCNNCEVEVVRVRQKYFYLFKGKTKMANSTRLGDSTLVQWAREAIKFQRDVLSEGILFS